MPPIDPLKRRVTYTLPELGFPGLKARKSLIYKPEAEVFLGLHFGDLEKPGNEPGKHSTQTGEFVGSPNATNVTQIYFLGKRNQFSLFLEAAGRNLSGFPFQANAKTGKNQFPRFFNFPKESPNSDTYQPRPLSPPPRFCICPHQRFTAQKFSGDMLGRL